MRSTQDCGKVEVMMRKFNVEKKQKKIQLNCFAIMIINPIVFVMKFSCTQNKNADQETHFTLFVFFFITYYKLIR